MDADAALALAAEFDSPAAVVVKHANPSGAAIAGSVSAAFDSARAADPVSAYGGIVAVNRTIDLALARSLVQGFLEVVIAPDADADARHCLAQKAALRILVTGTMPAADAERVVVRPLSGGFLVQTDDVQTPDPAAWSIATEKHPGPAQCRDLAFAQIVAKHVKSNAIVLARDGVTVGIGAGQMSRVDAARLAIEKAGAMARDAGEPLSRSVGAVVASDAFFPFADGLTLCADAGVRAAIQPGGSKRDSDVIAAANSHDIAMVFTGTRHFRH